MSKHLAYLLPTVLIIGVFILATKSWRAISLRTWSLGLAIIGLTVLPWHLAQWTLYGDSFTQVYFFREVYDPAISSGEHPLGYLFYLVTIKDGFFPWSILVPASVGWIFSRQSKNHLHANVLLIVWISGVLSIITLSEVKLFWYVLPAYPPLAILVAQLLFSFLKNRDSRYLDISVLLSFGLVLSLTVNEGNPFGHLASQGMTRVHFLDELQSGYQSQGVPFVLVLASIGTLILTLWLLVARRARVHSGLRWVRFLIVACLFGTAFHGITMPLRFSKYRSAFHQVCQEVSKRCDTHRTLLIALPRRKIRAPAHVFYIKQIQPPARVVTTPRKLIARSRRVKPSRLILFDRDLFRRIGRAHPPYWFRDLRVLFENEDYSLFEVVPSSD